MKEGEKWTSLYDLSSLRVLGTVGEPINPEAWMWYHRNVGAQKLPIMDTWWQTETGRQTHLAAARRDDLETRLRQQALSGHSA